MKKKRIFDPNLWEMSEENKRKLKSGMLTYEDAEPIQVHAPQVEMMPSPRRGFLGRIKDRILGPEMKPQAMLVLDKEAQERLRKQLEDLRRDDLTACWLTEEDVKEHFLRPTVLARGHHIRNADGTVTDVSNDPNYVCK